MQIFKIIARAIRKQITITPFLYNALTAHNLRNNKWTQIIQADYYGPTELDKNQITF